MVTSPVLPASDALDLASLRTRVERGLTASMARAIGPFTPPTLASALHHAVFPGGARLRPQLCLLVAAVNGDPSPVDTDAAAVAVELLHCASLVHDDLPCFDGAATRRGRASTHAAFGEPLAVLVGDGLIVHAFRELASAPAVGPLARVLADASGALRGLVAGQAWESEAKVPLEEYHRAKTASLFEAAAVMGAIAAGVDEAPWRAFGELLGRAYQAADDVADATATAAEAGKCTGRDEALRRPSLVRLSGVEAARARASILANQAIAALPPGPAAHVVSEWLTTATRLG